MTQDRTARSFKKWMEAVDRMVIAKVGLSVHDLSAINLRGEFEQGVSPGELFESTVRGELEDLGFPLHFMEELEAPIPWLNELIAELEEPF